MIGADMRVRHPAATTLSLLTTFAVLLGGCGRTATCEDAREQLEEEFATVVRQWDTAPPEMRAYVDKVWAQTRAGLGLPPETSASAIEVVSIRQVSASADGMSCDCEVGIDIASHPAAMLVIVAEMHRARRSAPAFDKIDEKAVAWHPFKVLLDTEGRVIVRAGSR
jgi:hypothetical protein